MKKLNDVIVCKGIGQAICAARGEPLDNWGKYAIAVRNYLINSKLEIVNAQDAADCCIEHLEGKF
jgi:hypothetical protein